MTLSPISRRTLLKHGGAALGSVSVLRLAGPAHAFPRTQDAVVIPWLDQPEPNPVPDVIVRQLTWEQLDSWLTPPDQFFVIKHYDEPKLNEADYRLEIGGLVAQPMALTLGDLKSRERQEVTFTLECSGNSAFPFNKGLVGNATWAGTIISATTIRNRVSRNRKLIHEKANAARLQRASGRSVEGTEMMMLFTKAPAIPWALITPR